MSAPYEPLMRRLIQGLVLASAYFLYLMVSEWWLAASRAQWGYYVFTGLLMLAWPTIPAYMWGFRVALWAKVEPSGVLRYRMAFRGGRITVNELRYIKYPNPLVLRISILLIHGGGKVHLLGGLNYADFVAELQRQNPNLGLRVPRIFSGLERLNERANRTRPFRAMHRILPVGFRSDKDKQKGIED